MKTLSVVVPVYNEHDCLTPLYERLKNVLATLDMNHEIIFVNDGSTDSSYEVMERLRGKDPCVRTLDFSRNFGHQVALTAGMDFAFGDAVVVMDADLQHPPELIPKLLDEWKEGNDIVYTVRKKTAGISFFKRLASGLFYKFLSRISETPISPAAADFRLVDRKVVCSMRCMRERSRFLRAMVHWTGFQQTSVEFDASERYAGSSKYSLPKMLRFGIDGVTAFSRVPLRLATYLGLLFSVFAFMYAAYALAVRLFTSRTLPGWTSLIVTVLLLSGAQLFTIGVLGEYVGRIYDETKGRPLYLIRRAEGFDHKVGSAQGHEEEKANF